jgi:hypothetical protein
MSGKILADHPVSAPLILVTPGASDVAETQSISKNHIPPSDKISTGEIPV